MSGRRILLTGLPAGVGATTLALELGRALGELGRSTAVASSLKSLPASLGQRPAGRSPHGVVFGLGGGEAYIPLELLRPANHPEALAVLCRDCEFLLLDRFTGLAIRPSDWYSFATEVIVIVDGQPENNSKALGLLARICQDWPQLPVYLVFNRIPEWPDWAVQGRDFNQKCENRLGRRFPALGGLPITAELARCRQQADTLLGLYPNHPGSRVVKHMARQLLHMDVNWAHDPAVRVHHPGRVSPMSTSEPTRSLLDV